MSFQCLYAVVIVVVSVDSISANACEPPKSDGTSTPANPVIENLIKQLGHPNFSEREAATKRLTEMIDAKPYLLRAASSSDAEIAKRATAILAALPRKLDPARLDSIRKYAEAGRLDIAIHGFTLIETAPKDRRYWALGFDMAKLIHQKVLKKYPDDLPKGLAFRFRSLNDFLIPKCDDFRVEEFIEDTHFFSGCARAAKIHLSREQRSIIAANRVISITQSEDSVLFSDGLGGGNSAVRCIIMTDGDAAFSKVRDSIVIAHGDIRGLDRTDDSILICSGKFKHAKDPYLIVNNSYLRCNVANPVGFVKWFETRELGIETEQAANIVRIVKLDANEPFAKGGCKIGDQVLAVGSSAIESLYDFRHALMTGLLEGNAKITVLRDEKKMNITVPLKLKD